MRFYLMVEGQEGVTWPQWLGLAAACETYGFDGLVATDHYLSVHGRRDRGSFDVWAVLAALAVHTESIRLGTLVSPVTFRPPGVLAKTAATVDHISGGRIEIGLGAGWMKREHEAHGFVFGTSDWRIDMLEEQLEIVHGLFTQPAYDHAGPSYRLVDCPFLPKPLQQPRPPIVIGGTGAPKLAAVVARFADEFNTPYATPEECRRRFDRVRAVAEELGRRPETLATSLMTGYVVGATPADVERRARAIARWMSRDDYAAFRRWIDAEWIVGTPDAVIERLAAYASAGVERIVFQHHLNDDLETVALLAREVMPRASRIPASVP